MKYLLLFPFLSVQVSWTDTYGKTHCYKVHEYWVYNGIRKLLSMEKGVINYQERIVPRWQIKFRNPVEVNESTTTHLKVRGL